MCSSMLRMEGSLGTTTLCIDWYPVGVSRGYFALISLAFSLALSSREGRPVCSGASASGMVAVVEGRRLHGLL